MNTIKIVVSSVDEKIEINWQLPPTSLLEENKVEIQSGNIDQNVKIIENTFTDFGMEVEMKDVNIGPTVTQYTFKPPTGVKLTKITSLQNDLALALAAHPIRVEAPIPGKSLVGIEIPNKRPAPVRLKEILDSPTFLNHQFTIPILLGRNIAGQPAIDDLTKMPHLLIAGATGSGKSVFINTTLLTLLSNFTPDQIKFILIDPKRVELSSYNKLPHLLTPVVTEAKNALTALKWGIEEMNQRYKILSENKSRNIYSYNHKNPNKPLPYIIIIIDELADLMMTAGNEIETAICRLAQMARATGIHLIVATQRPSVDVITGLIKANIATRIAFAVASQIDSRTILDGIGAEKLLGKGDMLYISRETGKPTRIQGVLVSDQEIDSITQFWKNEGPPPNYLEQIIKSQESTTNENIASIFADVDDDLIQEVVELIVTTQQASASYLQRKLKIGYARAARLIDILEQKQIISPQDGNKPRQVLVKSLDEIK
ncbi:DNA translocase FtsK [Patescibacteria group bacterium]|nr:DNA translocase FtsK [Patescibacteria group bacterium]